MAKQTKKTATRTAPAPLDAKIVVLKGAENPFREGTGVYKRVAAVLACKGKTVETAIKKGARRSTVTYLAKAKIIRIAA